MASSFFQSSAVALAISFGSASGAALASDLPSRKGAPPAPPVPSVVWIDAAFNAKVLTDYNFRGISQTDRKPSVQGAVELQFYDNLFYAGVFASNVDLATKPPAEIDFFAGIRPKFGPVTFDFGVIHYYYPNEKQFIDQFGVIWTPRNTDYTEIVGKVSYNYEDKLIVGANVFYTRDWLNVGAEATYASVTAKYNLPVEGLAVSGELGRYWLGTTDAFLGSIRLPDYTYWNAGLSYTYKNLTADVRYHDTNLTKTNCFLLTSDPRGIARGNAGGLFSSKWCNPTVVASLSFDITASSLGIFAPK